MKVLMNEFDITAATAELQSSQEAKTYLNNRGISLEVATEYGFGIVDFPGVGPSFMMPYNAETAKFRGLEGKEFRHNPGQTTSNLLFGLEQLSDTDLSTLDVFITESELDALTLLTHGYTAVSVSSATSCISGGKLKLLPAHVQKLKSAKRIFIATDMDNAGQSCAYALECCLPANKTFRIVWPYSGKESRDPKDIGEVYTESPVHFRDRIEFLKIEALKRPPLWRSLFKSYSEMEQGEVTMLIRGFLPEGVTFLGGLSDSGKTWLGLSMAKAITTGKRFLNRFDVPEVVPVLYMTPESGEKAFRSRMEKMGLTGDNFFCRTIQDGVLELTDPRLLSAVEQLKPVVFLDTAIRFADGEENSATDNDSGLANAVFGLIRAGARAVVGIHHAPKASGKTSEMTLENMLRGTGDFGAMCDAVYGLKNDDKEKFRVRVECVKAKDFEKARPFVIQGKPFINKNGDFGFLEKDHGMQDSAARALAAAIMKKPGASYQELSQVTGIAKGRIKKVAAEAGFEKIGGKWCEEGGEIADDGPQSIM